MVFHLLERVLNPDNFQINFNSRSDQLLAEGFSPEEAKHVAWLMAHRNDGKLLGIVAGVFILYATKNTLEKNLTRIMPRFTLRQWAFSGIRLAILVGCYREGDYLYTSRRYGGNQQITNNIPIVSNRHYIENKESFIQNFEPLNRKFTQEEIDQFLVNQKGENPRKLIHNPYLHTEWVSNMQTMYQNKYAPWDLNGVKEQIEFQNHEKIAKGEKIVFKPFKVLDYIDMTGIRFGLKQSPFTTHWTLVE